MKVPGKQAGPELGEEGSVCGRGKEWRIMTAQVGRKPLPFGGNLGFIRHVPKNLLGLLPAGKNT